MTGLLERLLEYRAVINDENKENRMNCTVNLLVKKNWNIVLMQLSKQFNFLILHLEFLYGHQTTRNVY